MTTSWDDINAKVRAEHVVSYHESGWGCSCGAGRVWPLAPLSHGRAARDTHLRAAVRKAYRIATQTPPTDTERRDH
jgi:hypothetical protein